MTGNAKALLDLLLFLALQNRLVSHLLELLMKLLNHLFPFSHDSDVALVHIVLEEEFFAGDVFLLQSFDLLQLRKVFKFKL